MSCVGWAEALLIEEHGKFREKYMHLVIKYKDNECFAFNDRVVFIGHSTFKSKGVCGFGEEQGIFVTEYSEFISNCLSCLCLSSVT